MADNGQRGSAGEGQGAASWLLPIAGTDLEFVVNRRGDALVLHLNKAGVTVYRTLLIDACKEMPADHLRAFSPFAQDTIIKIGDLADDLRRASAALREADG
jgi:hypothetical protein